MSMQLRFGQNTKSALVFYAIVNANQNGILPHLEKLVDYANMIYRKDGISLDIKDIGQSLIDLMAKKTN